MAIKNSWSSGEVLTAADLTDTMKGVSINPQTGTSYTFSLTDGFVTLSNASGGTATIPTNATAAFNTGAVIGVMNAGTAGSFVIAPAATVTLNAVSGTTTLAPLESATLVKLGTNTWQLSKGGGLPKATYSSTTGSPTVDTTSRPGKTILTFSGSGSISISQAGTVEALIVGGGGGGGNSNASVAGSGGGGGGVLYDTALYLPSGTLTITVPGGGAVGGANGQSNNGGAARCGSYYAPGGGGGAGAAFGLNGGSGGGGGSQGATAFAGGAGTSGLGNNGGTGVASNTGTGGGGGASAAGSNGATTTGGAGGAGLTNSIDGTSRVYGSGGGGGGSTAGGAGGTNAGNGTTTTGTAGAANFGGGGGGGGTTAPQAGGAGGSGRVVLVFG